MDLRDLGLHLRVSLARMKYRNLWIRHLRRLATRPNCSSYFCTFTCTLVWRLDDV